MSIIDAHAARAVGHRGSSGSARGWRAWLLRRVALGLGVALLSIACAPEPVAPVALGTLERDRIELVAEAAERIVALPFKEGDRVEEGDVVARLDDTLLRSGMPGLRARVQRAEAVLAELTRGPRQEEIDEARARLAEIDSALEDARNDFDRVRTLQGRGAESKARLDQSQARFLEVQARQQAAVAALDRLLNGTTREELERARADLAAARADIDALQVRIDRLTLVSPRSGVVDAVPYELGERPAADSVLVVLLADQAPYARVYLPAPMRVGKSIGSPAWVSVQGYDTAFRGTVRVISADVAFTPFYALTERDRSRLAYLAEIDLTEPTARDLPTGIPVQVRFDSAEGAETSGGADE